MKDHDHGYLSYCLSNTVNKVFSIVCKSFVLTEVQFH